MSQGTGLGVCEAGRGKRPDLVIVEEYKGRWRAIDPGGSDEMTQLLDNIDDAGAMC
jgi:hypothetical protein